MWLLMLTTHLNLKVPKMNMMQRALLGNWNKDQQGQCIHNSQLLVLCGLDVHAVNTITYIYKGKPIFNLHRICTMDSMYVFFVPQHQGQRVYYCQNICLILNIVWTCTLVACTTEVQTILRIKRSRSHILNIVWMSKRQT